MPTPSPRNEHWAIGGTVFGGIAALQQEMTPTGLDFNTLFNG
jgi:hypothetical protein